MKNSRVHRYKRPVHSPAGPPPTVDLSWPNLGADAHAQASTARRPRGRYVRFHKTARGVIGNSCNNPLLRKRNSQVQVSGMYLTDRSQEVTNRSLTTPCAQCNAFPANGPWVKNLPCSVALWGAQQSGEACAVILVERRGKPVSPAGSSVKCRYGRGRVGDSGMAGETPPPHAARVRLERCSATLASAPRRRSPDGRRAPA